MLSITSKPVGFELTSNMHIFYAFGNHIYSLSLMTCIPYFADIFIFCTCVYVFLVWQTYFIFCIHANNHETCAHMYNTHEVVNWQAQIFYICNLYLFFHIYYPFGTPCLVVILFS